MIVPPYPGIAAAMGLLATDMVYEYAATTYQRLSKLDAPALQRRFEELEAAGARPARGGRRPRPTASSIQRIADCRYLGQGYELRVDVASGTIDDDWAEKVRADFHDIHEREYSRRFEDSDIEIPNIRVRGIGLMPPLDDAGGRGRAASRRTTRSATRARRGSGSTARSSRSRRATTTAQRSRPATARRARRSSTSTTRRP